MISVKLLPIYRKCLFGGICLFISGLKKWEARRPKLILLQGWFISEEQKYEQLWLFLDSFHFSDIRDDKRGRNFLAKAKQGDGHYFLWINAHFLSLLSRLRAGRDQTHHLPRGAQVWRSGRGHHSYCVEGCTWRPGVPPQERTDPQVTTHLFVPVPSNVA